MPHAAPSALSRGKFKMVTNLSHGQVGPNENRQQNHKKGITKVSYVYKVKVNYMLSKLYRERQRLREERERARERATERNTINTTRNPHKTYPCWFYYYSNQSKTSPA